MNDKINEIRHYAKKVFGFMDTDDCARVYRLLNELADLLEAQENSSAKLDDTIAEPVAVTLNANATHLFSADDYKVLTNLPSGTKLYAEPPKIEAEKAINDAIVYGSGFMLDGKHIPHGDVFVESPKQAPVVDKGIAFDRGYIAGMKAGYALRHPNDIERFSQAIESRLSGLREAREKLGQTTDKACSAVVPDGLIDAVKEIAGSHTDNEITDRPVWWIIDPRQILKPSVHEFYGTFKGPFFSREAATEYMESHRYRYGKHVKVYCGSCNDAPQFKKLYDISAAMLKGEK